MPRDKSIKKVLVIGSGPIVIGQAAEFDYAGTQACRALREDGVEIILVNSNPATIMTDKTMADKIYIEPLTPATVKRIIEKEKPDSILSGLGGQTGLNLCMSLVKDGFLKKHNVRLLGASPEAIDKSEDRRLFKETMQSIAQPCIPSVIAENIETSAAFADEIGYPVIVRPSFTLGGSGGGIAGNRQELLAIAHNGLQASPINQILVERCVAGWKEIEFEVMRDGAGNVLTVCSMENFDPVGIHTGDSIVIAPTVTLSDKEYQMLRSAALDIITALGVEGGCNVQFALNPDSFEYAVIEVNPRVSRSSALASKATGYPIAKVATKIALGYRLDEIVNAVTGKTYAAFEPALDYVAVKLPKWPFDKFVYAKRELGTQMKATGEVMAIADTFETAILKAVRGAELGTSTLYLAKTGKLTDVEIKAALTNATDERLFVIAEALRRGMSIDEIHALTKIDKWFLGKLAKIAQIKNSYSDKPATYKMVDTCAGEFKASTPYFYGISAEGFENEALPFIESSDKKRVIVIGSGPIRIGQGIEFDYACVHCVRALKTLGYEAVIINNNPETVSTDFDTSDRLYFEPLTETDVMNIINLEKPFGVVVAFGGQTAIKLTKALAKNGVKIIGTPAEGIDAAEDRKLFDALLESLDIKRPQGFTVATVGGALRAAKCLGYPVLLRPSYVLGGQNMIIASGDEDVTEYMGIILAHSPENQILIDKYILGKEIEVDAICDGQDILIPGIMEHIERAGIHSGDSIAIYPATNIDDELAEKIISITKKLCLGIGALGLTNIQYIVSGKDIYVIEANPRASRTVPYLSKVTGVPMCDLAVRVSLGEKLKDLGFGTGLYKTAPYTAVKVPVFSFEKLTDLDTLLGPEMKSTGEVLGIGKSLPEALYKGLTAAGYTLKRGGGVFITVRDSDKKEIAGIAAKFAALGFGLYGTKGTAEVLVKEGLACRIVNKISENDADNTMTLLESGKITYIIATSSRGRDPRLDEVKIRRKAVSLRIPCLTSPDTADALAGSLLSRYSEKNTELVDINKMRKGRLKIEFVKMQGLGNDYIYIDCFNQKIDSPECLAVALCDRHYGVGGDGIVLIMPPSERSGIIARMRMFNLDGSEGAMCGNAIRCVAKYLYDKGIAAKKAMRIETASGVKSMKIFTKNNIAAFVTVDMGKAELSPDKIPAAVKNVDRVINYPLNVGGNEHRVTCLSVGNPHCVTFCDNTGGLNLESIGPQFENHPFFPDRVNTEFVEVIDRRTLKMRVFERGSGETLACGTGACAAVAAAVLNDYCDKGEDIRVILRGGELIVNYTEERIFMTGTAEKVYEGVVEI